MAKARYNDDRSLEDLKKEAQARADEEAEREKNGDGLPDGGWGWVVVVASLMCNIVVDGVCYSFPVFKDLYKEEFHTTYQQAGWVGSLLAGCYLTVGPMVSVLAEKFGSRKVTIAGSVVSCIALMLSTQATSIEMLIVTWGVIGGVGFGMIYLPAIVTVGHWFDKKRAFATGLSVCGSGIGMFIFPPLTQRLINEYDWRGAHLILAGIVLNCAVCGAIFRPLDKVKPRRECYQSTVEIQRGAIMKALIEEKKRQRTISNGSLDNCIITKDNRLIKIDPALLECKRNNSFIARFKRSLGFSSQSLNRSKSSLCGIPSIVIDAVNEAQKGENGAKFSPIYRPGKTSPTGLTDLPKSDDSSDSGVVVVDRKELTSDSVSLDDFLLKLAQEQQHQHMGSEVSSASSCHSVNNPIIFTGQRPHNGLDGSIISVQVMPHIRSQDSSHFPRKRSSQSESSSYSYNNPVLSASQNSFVSRSLLSIPQQVSQCSIESIAAEVRRAEMGTTMRMLYVLRDMLEINLLKNPIFALLLVASFLTLLAFFIPFFYISAKAAELGMGLDEENLLLSIIGLTNTVGRVISGWIADRPWANVLHLNNGVLIVAGVATILVGVCENYSLLCVYAALFGFCVAVFVSLRSILLVELLGLDLLTKSFGMLILFQGIATMVGAPMAGRIVDTTGTVSGSFFMAGILLLVSGLLGFPLWFLQRRKLRKDPPKPLLPDQESCSQQVGHSSVEFTTITSADV